MPRILDDYFTEPQLAEELGREGKPLKIRTLQNWKTRGLGPPWVRVRQQVLYPKAGVRKWLEANTRHPVRARRAEQSRDQHPHR